MSLVCSSFSHETTFSTTVAPYKPPSVHGRGAPLSLEEPLCHGGSDHECSRQDFAMASDENLMLMIARKVFASFPKNAGTSKEYDWWQISQFICGT